MLSVEALAKLPDHRLKEYLKKVRKNLKLAENDVFEGQHLTEEHYAALYEQEKFHFAEVKLECSHRPNFK